MNTLFISLLIINLLSILTKQSETPLKVEILGHDGSTFTQDLLEYINAGHGIISRSPSQRKAIMVMGLTGVGKSTLVNYLSDIPLKCLKINGVWRIDLVNQNRTISCGFKIGHISSETAYSSACTQPGSDHSFIDNPGFQDNRGFEIEIANSFFREIILNNVAELKFILVFNHADVIDRRVQFFDTIKRFSDFISKL